MPDSALGERFTIHVSPDGASSGKGNLEDPLSLAGALTSASPGTIIELAEGVYVLDKPLVIPPNVCGAPTKPIVVESRVPRGAVIEGSELPAGSPLIVLKASNWHLHGIVFRSSKGGGLVVEGSCNRVEACEAHSNCGSGFCLRGVSSGVWRHTAESNHFIECRSFGNGAQGIALAPGFQVVGSVGSGNVLFRCMAYGNEGSGFDVAPNAFPRQRLAVELDRCVSFDNGTSSVDARMSEGARCAYGFLLRGAGAHMGIEAWHCAAFDNASGGFALDRADAVPLRFCSSKGNGCEGQDYLRIGDPKRASEMVLPPDTCDCCVSDDVRGSSPICADEPRELAGADASSRARSRVGAKVPSRKDVLVLISSRGRGGAERVACRIATALSERHDVRLLSFVRRKSVYPVGDKVGLIDASYDKRESSNPFIVLAESVRKWVNGVRWVSRAKKGHPSLTSVSLLLAPNVLNAVFGGNRKVMSERNDPSLMPGGYFKWVRRCYRRADWVVFQSRAVQSMFDEGIRRKSCVIANPVEVGRVANPERAKKIVTAGRFVPQKNHALLLHAFALFKEDHPEYSLHLYGEGSLQGDLEELACELGVESSVHFEGFCDDVHERMADAQMFVLPSSFEGMPNALVEAMLMGIASITTDCAVTSELVTDGWDALVVPRDDAQALARAMRTLAEDDDLRLSLETHAMARAADFSTQNIVRQWERIL